MLCEETFYLSRNMAAHLVLMWSYCHPIPPPLINNLPPKILTLWRLLWNLRVTEYNSNTGVVNKTIPIYNPPHLFVPVDRAKRGPVIQKGSVYPGPADHAHREGEAAQCHRRGRGRRPRAAVRAQRAHLAHTPPSLLIMSLYILLYVINLFIPHYDFYCFLIVQSSIIHIIFL